MIDTIIGALITGGITLIGVLISNGKKQAIFETRVEELTREVREHNDFAKRIPVVENDIKHIKDEILELKEYHK